jgi:Methionyl-tRNA synthetase
MNTVLFLSLNIIVKASIMLLPIIPNSANKVLDILNISLKNRNFHNIEQLIDANLNINNPVPIFPRIEK